MPEDQEGGDESVVEVWDRLGRFGDTAQSAEKFREFLDGLSRGTSGNSKDVDEIVFVGQSFARVGRSNEALIVCESLGRLYRQREFATVLDRIAEGLVSIGSELLDQGLRLDAVRVFDATSSLLRDSDSPALRQSLAFALSERGLALKDEAYASGSEALMEWANSAFSELEDRFGGISEAPFERLVAIGTYNRGGALGALGRVDEAASCFSQLVARYGSSRDTAFQELAMFAAVRERMMLAIPEVPAYVSVPVPEMDQYWMVNGVVDLEQVAWFMEADPEKKRAMIEDRLDAALRSHRQASEILMQYRVKAVPFALFLRSFEPEGFASVTGPRWPKETGLDPHVITLVSAQAAGLERRVVEAFRGRGSVICVGNRDSLLESASIIPRLFLPDEGWRKIVEALIRNAHLIVVGVEGMTPGVRWELESIEKFGRAGSTLVMLTTDKEAVDWRGVREGFKIFGSLDRGVPLATKKAAELSGFERVLDQDEIPTGGLGASPMLIDLLQDMEAAGKLDPEARVKSLAGRK